MDIRFKNIKVLIWDFDGTLYRPIPQMIADRLQSAYQVITRHTGWPLEKTIAEFSKVYQIKTPSITKTSAILSKISLTQAAFENELYKDRKKYLQPDPQLVQLFKQLNSFIHFMLVNGIKEKTIEGLQILGVAAETFKEIVTSEIVGVNKPDFKGYKYILQKTHFKPDAHLMIGDREEVDLVPAKKLGMKTCLVWSDGLSQVPDITLPTVYDVGKVLV